MVLMHAHIETDQQTRGGNFETKLGVHDNSVIVVDHTVGDVGITSLSFEKQFTQMAGACMVHVFSAHSNIPSSSANSMVLCGQGTSVQRREQQVPHLSSH